VRYEGDDWDTVAGVIYGHDIDSMGVVEDERHEIWCDDSVVKAGQ
jgi:hypothetical protein